MFYKKIIILFMIMGLMFTACGGAPASPKSTPVSGDFNGKVDIGGRSLFLRCRGEGSPTVILEGDLGENVDTWNNTILNLWSSVHVCSYTRANMLPSDPAPGPRTSKDFMQDLRLLLDSAQVPDPYILVGHGAGAWNVLLYAQKYPKKVAELVLVEPLHPDEYTRALAALPAEDSSQAGALSTCRKMLESANLHGRMATVQGFEQFDFPQSADQVRAVKSIGKIPLIVITTTKGIYSVGTWKSNCGKFNSTLHPLHQQNNKDFLALSSQSKETLNEYTDAQSVLGFGTVSSTVKEVLAQVKR